MKNKITRITVIAYPPIPVRSFAVYVIYVRGAGWQHVKRPTERTSLEDV
jgi:hypothetical protein